MLDRTKTIINKKVHVWTDNELKEQIEKYCKENDILLGQLTRKVLKASLKNNKMKFL